MQLADSQERHAQLDERVIEPERKLTFAGISSDSSGAPGARSRSFALRSLQRAVPDELAAHH
jgi:hypothetical protein